MEHLQHKAIWFPGRVRIGRARVRPLALGQLRLLEAVNSPFLYNNGPATPSDIALALLIIRLPWRLARRILPHSRLVRLFTRRIHPCQLPIVTGQLDAYLAAELWTPEMFQRAGAAPSTFPAATGRASYFARAVADCGAALTPFRRRSPWDYTCREASLACVLAAEARGAEFVTREEADHD